MPDTTCLAVDLGATSGRVMLGTVGDARVRLTEVHRFTTRSVRLPDGLHWDVTGIYGEILVGVRAAIAQGASPRGIAFDTWGVDYALLSDAGTLLGAPFHHRDTRTAGLTAGMDAGFLYRETGIQTLEINTLTQLLAEPRQGPIAAARSLLFLPDLLGYLFSGVRTAERTIASTSQLLDGKGERSAAVLDLFDLPDLLPPIVEPGTPLGPPLPHLTALTGFTGEVLSVAGHDTASAIAAIPVAEPDFAFVSCGTWGLVGFELREPNLSEASREAGFTNEHGVDGTYRYLRNVTGLWLLSESLRSWGEPATSAASAGLVEAAGACPRFRSVIDPLDPVFIAPGDIPERIRDFCRSSGQRVPATRAEVARCIIDSLALSFASAIDAGSAITGIEPGRVHIVGGGSQIEDLCATLADLTGVRVVAGPVEATALGNVLMQARALGELGSLSEIRATVAASTRPREYLPRSTGDIAAARLRFTDLARSTATA